MVPVRLLHTSIAPTAIEGLPDLQGDRPSVQSRLPFRKKICGECGGTGKQLLRRAKARG
jgi:hypothetical protein